MNSKDTPMPASSSGQRKMQRHGITDKDLRGMVAASELDSYQRSTMLTMADGLNRKTLEIHIGIHRLADALGLSRRATINRVQSLESTGVIVKLRKGGGRFENGRGRINIWGLDLSRLRQTKIQCESDAVTSGKEREAQSKKGAADFTVKGEAEQLEPCSQVAATVKPTAQDPMSSTFQKKKTNVIARPCHPRGGGSMPKKIGDLVRPYVNQYASAEQRLNDRRRLLRFQGKLLASKDENGKI